MGRYVPPEHEGTTSANKLAGKYVPPSSLSRAQLTTNRHVLGSRARKAGQGILTVRFEMPFAIWCTTCPKPAIIGQGVRFNAEKKKVGNYHSTPIYSFRMKHSVCGGWIEIRTDPKNTAYVVIEGAKKRDTGDDKLREGDFIIRTEEEREQMQRDAFATLENKVEDKRQQVTDKSRIEELYREKQKAWDDPYAMSKRLRNQFREERKLRQKKEASTEELKDRMGLGIELLEEAEEDRKKAEFVDFGTVDAGSVITKAQARPLFAMDSPAKTKGRQNRKNTKIQSKPENSKEKLQLELGANTRAVLDPFLATDKPSVKAFPQIRRKKVNDVDVKENANEPGSGRAHDTIPLVDYETE
ncbi:MAG: hypothetical protein LQ351_007279 [Letrouitia transgressa]|nr:MAG: hypothetical protein LQ351_007279 [Letrouitia transgressa]